MSLRCSLLGHEYGESEIERDREERGNEVVISVVELERCTRCEKTRTISENTEVTQLSQPRSSSETNPAESGTTGVETRSDADPRSRGSGLRPRPEAGSDSGGGSGIEPRSEAEMGFEADPRDEDTEIIEDDPAVEDRDPGDWPDVEDHEGREESPNAWPEPDGEDEGFDARTPDGRTDLDFGGGLTPQADQGAEIIESSDGANTDDGDSEPTFVSAGPRPAPDRPADSGGETTLYCPNCGTAGLEERDSLRAGDICPECHRGYLAERER